jgi:SAM-dependent methyltransferase
MHPSCFISALLFFNFLHDFLVPTGSGDAVTPPAEKVELRVLDIGAADINGNNFDAIHETLFYGLNSTFLLRYFGLDIEAGYNVDVVRDPNAEKLWDQDEVFDVIISSNCFEHDDFFWETFLKIAAALKPGGFILLVAPSTQPMHRYPVDNWRFYPDSGLALAKYARKKGEFLYNIYSDVPEKDYDYVGIFYKPESHSVPRATLDYGAVMAKVSAAENAFTHFGRSWLSNIVKSHQDEYFQLSEQMAVSGKDIAVAKANFEKMLLEQIPPQDQLLLNMSVLGGVETTVATETTATIVTHVGEGVGAVPVGAGLAAVNRKYHILSSELLFKIDHYYISQVNCRRDVGIYHPIENLMRPHRRLPTYYGGGRCPFPLTIVVTEEDFADADVLRRSMRLIQYQFELLMDATFKRIMETMDQLRALELHPPLFNSTAEMVAFKAAGYNTRVPYDRQKVIEYVYYTRPT